MACERVQFSKKRHGDGAGIVRKLGCNRKRIPAPCASSGQSKRFLAALVLAHAPVQKNCMTLHDAEARSNLHFLSCPATLDESQKSLVLLVFTYGVMGTESNRRHVDFQSNCSTTARLQCIIDSKYFIGELTSGDRRMHQPGRQNGNSEAPTVLPPDTEISVVF